MLVKMKMEEYVNKFLELLRYMDYNIDEKVNIQRLLSGLPQSYKDLIEFVEPTNLDDVSRKAMHFYEKKKRRSNEHQ